VARYIVENVADKPKIIAMSGTQNVDITAPGIDAYLGKPFTKDGMMEAMQGLANKEEPGQA
ncbi:MAG TPA: hypothetical protein PLO51_06000, partial [Candidatus Micrarchaeota archaeon]|nr:hypothetical protein [Candidatus Micrarchaeota archaeon]